MILFRPHRGTLEDAMRDVVEVATMADLHQVAAGDDALDVRVEPHWMEVDERNGWAQTYIVTVYLRDTKMLVGVAGFTNGIPAEG